MKRNIEQLINAWELSLRHLDSEFDMAKTHESEVAIMQKIELINSFVTDLKNIPSN